MCIYVIRKLHALKEELNFCSHKCWAISRAFLDRVSSKLKMHLKNEKLILFKTISVKYDSGENVRTYAGFNICPLMVCVIKERLTAVYAKCSYLTFPSYEECH